MFACRSLVRRRVGCGSWPTAAAVTLRLDNFVSLAATRVCGADVQQPTGVEAPGLNRLGSPACYVAPCNTVVIGVAQCHYWSQDYLAAPAPAFPTLAVVGVANLVPPSHVTPNTMYIPPDQAVCCTHFRFVPVTVTCARQLVLDSSLVVALVLVLIFHSSFPSSFVTIIFKTTQVVTLAGNRHRRRAPPKVLDERTTARTRRPATATDRASGTTCWTRPPTQTTPSTMSSRRHH